MTRIAIHKCGEAEPIVRDATPEEEVKIEEARAAMAAQPPPVDRIAELEARIVKLERVR